VNNAKPNPLAPAQIPEKASVDGLEAKWVPSWEQNSVYGFNPGAPKENIYSIDTPPPTASGSLHVGHVFSYTHTDVVARFQRVCGKDVFYPMGGMTTVFRPSAGFRTTTGCVATQHFPTKKTSLHLRSVGTIRAPRQRIKCPYQGKTLLSSAKS